MRRIEGVARAATAFWRALCENGSGPTRYFADSVLETYLSDARLPRKDKLDSLMGIMTSFVAACTIARREIDSGAFAEHRPGQCWEGWIRRLTLIFAEHQLPTSARKDRDKNKTGKASPFVCFIDQFQKCFDARYRRGSSSLAEAIAKARRVSNPAKKATVKTRKKAV